MARSHRALDKARRHIDGYASDRLDWNDFGQAVIGILTSVVPAEAVCLATIDPDTALSTRLARSGIDDSQDDLFMDIELNHPDPITLTQLVKQPSGVGILADHVGGDPMSSPRCRLLLAPHFDLQHELRGVVRHDGRMWAAIGLYRAPNRPGFTPEDAAALASLEGALSSGVRRCLVADAETSGTSEGTDRASNAVGPALVVLDPDGRVEDITEAGQTRVHELGTSRWNRLPTAIRTTAAAARAASGKARPFVRCRLRSGEWVVVRAATLTAPGLDGRVAVSIEPATPKDAMDVVLAAFALTDREADVARGVVAGVGTADLAAALGISGYTVQDHLKAVFAKTGTSSRRALVTRLCGLPTPQRG